MWFNSNTLTSECGIAIDKSKVHSLEVIQVVSQQPHFLWYCFWLVVFYPMMLALALYGFTNKVYVCKLNGVSTVNVIVTLSKEDYATLTRSIATNTSESS